MVKWPVTTADQNLSPQVELQFPRWTQELSLVWVQKWAILHMIEVLYSPTRTRPAIV